MIITAIINEKNSHLYSKLMACLGRSPSLYSQVWVHSWRQNLRNLFHTYVDGLTRVFQSQSQGCTSAWSMEIVYPVPRRTRNQTGTQDRALSYHSTLRARIVLRAHPRNFFATWSTLPSPPSSRNDRALPSDIKWVKPTGIQTHALPAQWKTTHRY